MLLAKHLGASVIGVEAVEEAVRDAKRSRERNAIDGCAFYAGSVELLLPELLIQNERADVIILDPPRKGCEAEVLHLLPRFHPRQILYLSCNPSSLARDLQRLGEMGFTPIWIQPFDMFPQTYHVEVLVDLRCTEGVQGTLD